MKWTAYRTLSLSSAQNCLFSDRGYPAAFPRVSCSLVICMQGEFLPLRSTYPCLAIRCFRKCKSARLWIGCTPPTSSTSYSEECEARFASKGWTASHDFLLTLSDRARKLNHWPYLKDVRGVAMHVRILNQVYKVVLQPELPSAARSCCSSQFSHSF